jgi:hypothetical protein
MASAFTPGLTITGCTTVRKERRLPVRGDVRVQVGQRVTPETLVASVDVPGTLAVVRASAALGISPEQLPRFVQAQEGDSVKRDQMLGERKTFFGMVTQRCRSPRGGTVEYISALSGNIGIRGEPRPVGCTAYVAGTVVDIIEGEGAVIETSGAYVQGIFGVGGERCGPISFVASGGDRLGGEDISEEHRGTIVIHRGRVDASALAAASKHGVIGLVGASIIDEDLTGFLGYDIGVAITGEEDIPFSIILTEGFGHMTMPARTSELLRSLSGQQASISGATQIRAGVVRPEIIVPRDTPAVAEKQSDYQLRPGTTVRLIRRPNFGRIATVCDMPEKPIVIGTGSRMRVLTARLDDGTMVTVPRANVEILADSA